MEDLKIVYCKNCKHFEKRKINADATLYSCKKDCGSFHPDEAQLFKDRKCFTKKFFTKK
jgi:hypothetical protein